MIDFHAHILPGVDDGAADVTTALLMLKNAYKDGITTVISTSHIYIEEETDIDKFLYRRNSSYELLCDAIKKDGGKFPEIRLGAEVYVKDYISRYDSIARLAIGGTDYILLEMPMHGKWTQGHFEAIYNLTTLGLKPIMAHIDRYLNHKDEFSDLDSLGAVFQVNADAFLHKSMRKSLLNLYYNGYIHILGSDMHNLTSRKNHLSEAYDLISDKFGNEFYDYSLKNSELVLDNKAVLKQNLPKLGFFNRLKL